MMDFIAHWHWPQWVLAFTFMIRILIAPIVWAVKDKAIASGVGTLLGNCFLLIIIVLGGFFS